MENKGLIPEWAYNQGSLLLGAVSLTSIVVMWVMNPQAKLEQDQALLRQSLETIERNHLTHIQNDIAELKVEQKEHNEKLDKVLQEIVKLQTILEQQQ